MPLPDTYRRTTSSKKPNRSVVSNRIGMKIDWAVNQVNMHRLSRNFDMTSLSRRRLWRPPAARYCICNSVRRLPTSCRARVTSLTRCMPYSSWSIVHSYSLKLVTLPTYRLVENMDLDGILTSTLQSTVKTRQRLTDAGVEKWRSELGVV